jgi:hypothetical protein
MNAEQLNAVIGVIGYFEGSKVTNVFTADTGAVKVNWLMYGIARQPKILYVLTNGKIVESESRNAH